MDFERFKTVNVISKETFEQIVPGSEKVENQEVPPPPPPVHYSGNFLNQCPFISNFSLL